ncbi:MAG: galactokinase [Bacillota bacterium]|jgi:galactokinase
MISVEHYFAPGRVNLIGEHIDYNGGVVLPAALSLGICAGVRLRSDGVVRVRSDNEAGCVEVDLAKPVVYDARHGWANYPKGVVAYLQKDGFILSGCDIVYRGDLPVGAGLSSSAAIEVLTAYLFLYPKMADGIDRAYLARLCQRVENEYIGVGCGIMDQFAVANGRANHAILLDCESLQHEYVPVSLGNYSLVIINTGKKRALGESRYNERRAECQEALKIIQRHRDVPNLCQATLEDANRWIDDPILLKRARHVISEHLRTIEASRQLAAGNLGEFGRLLTASHKSLKEDYEVSGFELDTVVALALASNSCLGARMTGAGFGGCAIALVSKDDRERFQNFVGSTYTKRTGLRPEFYVTEIGDGVRRIPSRAFS